MTSKTIIIAVIVVAVIAVAGAAVVLSSGDDKDENKVGIEQNAEKNLSALENKLDDMKDKEADYPMLMILGNADWDDNIGDDDIAYIEGLIKNGYNYSDEFMCDANYDGLIDEKDVEMVKLLKDYNNLTSARRVNLPTPYSFCNFSGHSEYDCTRILHRIERYR